MEKHLLAAGSWKGSAELKRNCMNWGREICKCHKTPWATLLLVRGAGRASWMSLFGYKVPVVEIRYDQEGSQSLPWSPQGGTASPWGWLRAGAKRESFEWHLAKARAHVSFMPCKDSTSLSFTLGFLKCREWPRAVPSQLSLWLQWQCPSEATSLTGKDEFISRRIRRCGVRDAQLERIMSRKNNGRN